MSLLTKGDRVLRLNEKGFLLVLSGPSEVGKNTVLNATMQLRNDLVYSVSATTRPKRPHEVDGVNYFFLSEEAFQTAIEQGQLLEWAEFVGHKYGTPRSFVEEHLAKGYVVVMDVDIQGAKQIRERMPDAVLVFFAADHHRVEARLRGGILRLPEP